MALICDHGPVSAVSSFVTHYYRAGSSPFLNLSDLAEPELSAVLTELAAPDHQAMSARRFGPRYMALRRATELRARDLFITAGESSTQFTAVFRAGLE